MIKRLFTGAVAGLAGALVMHEFRVVWEALYPDSKDGIFGFDEESDVASVNKFSQLLYGDTPGRSEAEKIALMLHYSVGAAAGASYAVATDRWPQVAAGSGTAFGLALWLVLDEAAIGLSGLSDPLRKHLRSHVSAVVAHLLFGVVVDLSRTAAGEVPPVIVKGME